MDKKLAKRGYELAQKELKEKQVEEVKKMVLKTLEKLEELKKQKKDIEKKIKILKMDLDDLKEGRLDRIAERQGKDKEAKDTSVVIIIKEKEVIKENPWYWPYKIIWQYDYTPTYWTSSSDNTSITYTSYSCTITPSVAKYAAIGTYEVGDKIIHFR